MQNCSCAGAGMGMVIGSWSKVCRNSISLCFCLHYRSEILITNSSWAQAQRVALIRSAEVGRLSCYCKLQTVNGILQF